MTYGTLQCLRALPKHSIAPVSIYANAYSILNRPARLLVGLFTLGEQRPYWLKYPRLVNGSFGKPAAFFVQNLFRRKQRHRTAPAGSLYLDVSRLDVSRLDDRPSFLDPCFL
jgi:hypothetical protein